MTRLTMNDGMYEIYINYYKLRVADEKIFTLGCWYVVLGKDYYITGVKTTDRCTSKTYQVNK